MIIGKTDEVEVSFIIFLENGGLTLESHSWGEKNPDE